MGKHKPLLLVEDNADDEELTLMALQENHILNEVVIVRDGAEALDYLLCCGKYAGREESENPQLVLLDLNLPKVNGLDVLRRMREEPKTSLLPVVILTSSKEEEDILAGYQLRANSYVRKPVDFLQFSHAVKQLSLYWLVLNEEPPLRHE